MDTGAEHPETYEFIRLFNDFLQICFGVSITCLKVVINPVLNRANSYEVVNIESLKFDLSTFKSMISKYGVPYIGGMFCTDRLKLVPYQKYCDEKYGVDRYCTIIGIRSDEPERVVGTHKQKKHNLYYQLSNAGFEDDDIINIWRKLPETQFNIESFSELVNGDVWIARLLLKRYYNVRVEGNIRYMAEFSDMDKQDVLNYWSSMHFNLNIPEWSGNCVFCPKKSPLKVAAARIDNPVLYDKWLSMLDSKKVRQGEGVGCVNTMYRGKRHLRDLIASFDGSTGEEIKSRIRGGHMVDTNSCSESCDAIPMSVRGDL
jgi:hypothetical protein